MSASRYQRSLGSFEKAQVLTGDRFPYNLVAVLCIEGKLRADRLRRALDELQRRNPLLGARLVRERGGSSWQLRPSPPALPLRQAAGDWPLLVEEELVTGFDTAEGPLARCLWRAPTANARGDLVLTFHHAIVDAVAVGKLVSDLLALCGGQRPGSERSDAVLPSSADSRFPIRQRRIRGRLASLRFLLRQAVDETTFRWKRRHRPARPVAGTARCKVLSTALSVEETESVVRACRRQRVSLNSGLQAAMLLAVSRRRYGGERLPLRYFTFPLLRPYLEPPVDDGIFGSYLTTLRFTVDVGGEDRLWSLAAAIGRQIYRAARRGDKFHSSVWSPLSMKMVLGQSSQRMSTTALSYTGPLSFAATRSDEGEELTVCDVHAFVSNFCLGPEYTAQARLFRRRLVWDIVYLDADMEGDAAWQIAREMGALLVDAS